MYNGQVSFCKVTEKHGHVYLVGSGCNEQTSFNYIFEVFLFLSTIEGFLEKLVKDLLSVVIIVNIVRLYTVNICQSVTETDLSD